MKKQLIEELSRILGITILDVSVHQWGSKKYFRWEIFTDKGTVRLKPGQMLDRKIFRQSFLNQALLLTNKIPRDYWDDVLRKFMAVVKENLNTQKENQNHVETRPDQSSGGGDGPYSSSGGRGR